MPSFEDLANSFTTFLHSYILNPSHHISLQILIVILIATVSTYITRLILTQIAIKIAKKTENKWDDYLVKYKFLNRLALLTSVAILQLTIPLILIEYPATLIAADKIINIYFVFVLIGSALSFLSASEKFLESTQLYKDKPIASYIQLLRILLSIIALVLVLSILMSKSPLYFVGAFGAISAVLLLIFKDTILGLVASVQISANDMVRIGDWVELPKFGADGSVQLINLNTVKIKNWDNTTTTIPTYYFISEGFKNWRGMQDSKGRRIKRSFRISINSIRFVDKEMRERFSEIQLLKEYIASRQAEIELYNQENNIDTNILINGRRMTNIGVFRMYILNYLRQHPRVHKEMTLIARQLAADESGLPLEVYCFTNTTSFIEYETIQSDIFDHLFAAAPFFDLEIYQQPTGKDFQSIAKINHSV